MEAALNFDKSLKKLKTHRHDINSKEDLIDELNVEWKNMFVFASDEVILNVRNFLTKPSDETFFKASLAIRKDLWGLKAGRKLKVFIDDAKTIKGDK
ncbi:hypothetical protein tpqmel_0329 [Candidatus Gastranaerophilus sp. (ex Termes propinquus)]|nr:hypothetical protein tpqmel_0329 [Candidatus Gastranaerophilus sp. (ex Termes propinquus)]